MNARCDGAPDCVAAPAIEPLPESEVHLWVTELDQARDDSLLAQYTRMLSIEEQARLRRFHFERDQHRYLVTRALVRTVLSGYRDLAPSDWAFAANRFGRPEIDNPLSPDDDITFNLSHSNRLVVCAVRRSGALGVDTEHLGRDVPLAIANRYFSPAEVLDLFEQPPLRRPEHFLRIWTLKESYIKALGMGLSLPLDTFGFRFSSAGRITAVFDEGESSSRWAFWQLRVQGDNLISLCTARDCTLKLISRQVVPLRAAWRLDQHHFRMATSEDGDTSA